MTMCNEEALIAGSERHLCRSMRQQDYEVTVPVTEAKLVRTSRSDPRTAFAAALQLGPPLFVPIS